MTWVPHILVFIVPRQMVALGDPTRRSCDACESFGAMAKKFIKHATCRRRRVMGAEQTTHGHTASAQATEKRWKQMFNWGFIQQAFTRLCVRESLQHGADNRPFMQRADAKRKSMGVASVSKRNKSTPEAPIKSIVTAVREHTCMEDGTEGAGGGSD